MEPENRGALAGYVIGKYGTDCLLFTGIIKGTKSLKAYHEFKKAEKMMALETLAESRASKKALTELSKEWTIKRTEYLNKITIEMDKQGKHIVGHRNYLPTDNRSIFEHKNPEELLKKYAGKGEKIRGNLGESGFKERVDFGEKIGYFIKDNTEVRIPTTKGIIHYSKKGAHIVPSEP